MKSTIRLNAIFTLAVVFTIPVFTIAWTARASRQNPTPKTTPRITELVWMSGDWQTAPGGRAQIEEHWTLPAGGSMIGVGRTIAGDKTVEFEFLRIEQRGDDIFYVANPNAQCPQTDFKLTNLTGQQVIFENPEHDYPKRVIYRKQSDGSLVASIDAGEGTKSQSFAYLPLKK
ncbi:MAG TPA: DUF6265 family protein [Pyrinomonadaceae bacterium]|jgi:hypothetical protein|nr:DUF6265 family protein [Pyrinomonadaceae bacterium]